MNRITILSICFLAVLLAANTAPAEISSFNIDNYPGTKWNALGLGVDPENGNVFMTSLSYGGEDNLYKFSENGTLFYSKRVNLFNSPGDLLVVNSGNIFVLNGVPAGVLELTQKGDVLSSIPYVGWAGFGYYPDSNTFISVNYSDRTNPTVDEFSIDGTFLHSSRLNDSYLSLPGGHLIGAAYNPFTQTIFTYYLDQRGAFASPVDMLAEYKKDLDGEFYVANRYDLGSVGITKTVLAMDVNRANGVFYLQESNERIVKFSLTDLTLVPEPATSLLFLTGGTLLAGWRYIKRKKKA